MTIEELQQKYDDTAVLLATAKDRIHENPSWRQTYHCLKQRLNSLSGKLKRTQLKEIAQQ